MKTTMRVALSLCSALLLSAQVYGQPAKLDTARIEQLTGAKGTFDEKEGVFKVSLPRPDLSVTAAGVKLTPPMGLTSWAAFAGSDEKAVVDGDFAMYEQELQNVLKALRAANINIVAIHNHMAMEQPRVMFLHFWGIGPTAQLAKGIKAALDTQVK